MITKIVVPLDGSLLAETALPWAHMLATHCSADVVLVSVLEIPPEYAAWVTVNELSETPEWSGILDERRDYMQRLASQHGLDDATIDLRIGAPAREILNSVSEVADSRVLIVMSTRGYGGIKRLALGSVALQIIHNYDGPIMTVRDEVPATEPQMERLLVPVDGSDASNSAIERALELLGEPYPELHILRVIGTPTWATRAIQHGLVAQYLDATREWAQEQLDEARDQATAAGYTATTELRPHGNVVDEIIDAAEFSGSDVIAMCTHGVGGTGRIVIGSVADGVLRNSTRPVLLLRPNTED